MCQVIKEDRLDGHASFIVEACQAGYDVASSVRASYWICKAGEGRIVYTVTLAQWGRDNKE